MRVRGWLIALAVLAFIVGSCAVAYPLIADRLATEAAVEVVTAADEAAKTAEPDKLTAEREAAQVYNAALLPSAEPLAAPADRTAYEGLLNISGNGIMGSLSIPRIAVNLPIYHGTAGDTLEKGLGHLYGTSLPVGGTGTHAVITGHSGMAGKRMFTDLDQLTIGDTFCLRVLADELTYRVDQIVVTDPYDVSELAIDPTADYCTLLTCTPYGINSHRLLVRGVRVPDEAAVEDSAAAPEEAVVPAASTWGRRYIFGLLTGLAMAAAVVDVVLLILLLLQRRRRKKKNAEQQGGTK